MRKIQSSDAANNVIASWKNSVESEYKDLFRYHWADWDSHHFSSLRVTFQFFGDNLQSFFAELSAFLDGFLNSLLVPPILQQGIKFVLVDRVAQTESPPVLVAPLRFPSEFDPSIRSHIYRESPVDHGFMGSWVHGAFCLYGKGIPWEDPMAAGYLALG